MAGRICACSTWETLARCLLLFHSDMHHYRHAKHALNWSELFGDERTNEIMVKRLQSVSPVAKATLQCREAFDNFALCYQREGDVGFEKGKCAEEFYDQALCMGSILAPEETEKWFRCVNANPGDPKAAGLFEEFMAKTQEAMESHRNSASRVDIQLFDKEAKALSQCESRHRDEDDILDCQLGSLYPKEVEALKFCLESTNGDLERCRPEHTDLFSKFAGTISRSLENLPEF